MCITLVSSAGLVFHFHNGLFWEEQRKIRVWVLFGFLYSFTSQWAEQVNPTVIAIRKIKTIIQRYTPQFRQNCPCFQNIIILSHTSR